MNIIRSFIEGLTIRNISEFVFVSSIIFTAARLGQYIFFSWHTSPAILWPPTGIAVAILWVWGYRFAIPIFFGLFAASVIGPTSHLVPAIVTTPAGQTLGYLFAVYLLERFQFKGTFSWVRDVVVFFGVTIVSCMIAPTITTLISLLTGNLSVAVSVAWSRSWAGYIFSSLIFFPLIVLLARKENHGIRRSLVETIFVAVLVFVSVYFLFWGHIDIEFYFLFFALFFIAHFWLCLRFSAKAIVISIFITTIVGIAGLFLSPAPGKALNEQLFTTELFLFLVVPIFYLFSALVKERANTIKELEEAMARIEKESDIKNEFIAVLAHELRNPLAPVKTTLEILGLKIKDPYIRQLVDSAHQQVHVMRRLLDDLLDTTRVSQGKFQLQIERAHLCSMIHECIESTKELFQERSHTISQNCDNSVWVDVDPVRFEQVVVNLLNNAAKYTPPGGHIEIMQTVRRDMVEVRIKDNGVGIERGYLKDIFEPFWQVKNTSFREKGGIGLGLSLTKHIVEMHGGRIYVESPGKGKGSTFTILIPLARAYSTMPTPSLAQSSERSLPRFKILVVDDSRPAADALAKLLMLKGHDAETAYAGKDVHLIAQSFKPEVILLDIGLPDVDGYTVVKELRAAGFSQKIIALTGYGQKEDRQKALHAGFDHHITKPMSIGRLEEYLVTLTRDREERIQDG